MSGTINVNRGNGEHIIAIKGRFNFEMHSQFRTAYQGEIENCKVGKIRFVIDLAGTEYIDSSALGMLLLLREEAGSNDANIQIVNARPEIRKILETANFQRLFKIG
ncbi:anti-sigma-factor antagonist [Magnetococcus marinus MC-1]|uniref:Anti-sigma-factor antagonist n=1 Tax=Magnetococcus marinus (strain ATCC BAA-1437 / JCM 17883 / MC-1) TaxID=156889 RepID=A0LDM1_MAGMM|nr:STAS domain-containing protein [Magnetococcus marinus]ABK46064.1 anti-sigma-factor antagonist [Magnetococcus marinus MC-1]